MSDTPSVEYRRLGKTGLRVSVPVMGGMSYGDAKWHPWVLPEEEALPVLKAAWDAGITTFDSANMYSNGTSEKILGKFIKHYNIPRENVVIIDKIRFLVDYKDMSTVTTIMKFGLRNERDYVNQDGLSRGAILNQFSASLARLQTDYVDILMIHMPDAETPIEETMRTLDDLVTSGKVRYIGASNIKAWMVAEMNSVARANGWTEFSCVEVEHSLLYRTEEIEMFAYCAYKGLGVFGHASLMDGYLARPYGTKTGRTAAYVGTLFEKKCRESDVKVIGRVEEVAKKRRWTMAQVALAWSTTKVTSPVVGISSVQRLQQNLIGGKTLTEEEIKYLEELYEPQPPRF